MKRLLLTIILFFLLYPSFVFAQEIQNNDQTSLIGDEDNLVGYWNFNFDILDETSNDNDLTNNNSALFSVDAPFEGGTTSTPPTGQKTVDLEKDSSQYLSIADASQTDLDLNSDFTMEAWIKLESSFANEESRTIMGKPNFSGSDRQYRWNIYKPTGANHQFELALSDDGSSNSWVSSVSFDSPLATDTWYHVALSYDMDTGTGKFYLNGTQVGSDIEDGPTSIYNGTEPFIIGRDNTGGTGQRYWDGKIEDARVWNDVRTITEIQDNDQAELTGTEDNLVGYWQFNDDLLDETSNNNDLTNNNSAVFSDDAPFEGGTSSTSTDNTFVYLYEGNTGTSFANPYALTTVSTTTSTVDYVYDHNGNQTTDGTWTNTWDYNNRLVSSTNGISTSTYSYDQAGQRVKKTENGVVSIYPNRYYTIENGTIKKHIFAGDTELASVEGTTTTYHHVDHLSGSSVETDEEGYVTEVLDYYPFGEIRLDEKYTDYENKKKFTGHMYDDATGLYYMGARYQDPVIGRFVSEDPASFNVPEKFLYDPQQLNMYSYARNNPLIYIDPLGEEIRLYIEGGRFRDGLKSILGHSFVSVNGKNYSWSPGEGSTLNRNRYGEDLSVMSTEGYLGLPGKNNDKYSVYTFNTSEEQDKKIENFYQSLSDNYNNTSGDSEERLNFSLSEYNCTDVTIDALKSGGALNEDFNLGKTQSPNELRNRMDQKYASQSSGGWFQKIKNWWNKKENDQVMQIDGKNTSKTNSNDYE